MKIFSSLYNKMIRWAKHPHAVYYLFILSFAESSFFPIPPDVMMAPMILARRDRAWLYASGTTFFSILGGLFGYLIGHFFFNLVHPLIQYVGYENSFQQVITWFDTYGFWIMFVAGFAIIPYKLFTIAAGVTHMALLPFILGSIMGRGGRFFLVTTLLLVGGVRMEKIIERHIDRIGWICVALIFVGFIAWRYFHG